MFKLFISSDHRSPTFDHAVIKYSDIVKMRPHIFNSFYTFLTVFHAASDIHCNLTNRMTANEHALNFK